MESNGFEKTSDRVTTATSLVMDNSLFSALSHLRNDWRMRILEDYEQEREELGPPDIKLMPGAGRRAVWTMSKLLGADMNGIPGRACRLIERYLHKYITAFCNITDDDDERSNFKQDLFLRLLINTASCIQLSAKMSTANAKVNANHIRACLRSLGQDYSIQEINSNTFHVFSTLGFRVPLWTGVEEGQMFALEIGIPLQMLKGTAAIVNCAEFARDKIEHCVRDIAGNSPGSFEEQSGRPLQSLHLVLGAVAASARYLAFDHPDPVQHLADSTGVPRSLIGCIADIILTEILADSPEDAITPPKKRKLNDS